MTTGEYDAYDDLTLLKLAGREDCRAFDVLYDRYFDRLFSFVYNRLHIKEDSEEIVQEIFFSIWSNRHTLIINTTLPAYLFGACRLMILNSMRNQKVRKTYVEELSAYLLEHCDNSNEEYQGLHDLENAIEISLSQLSEKCQTVFRLSREQHLPISNIAMKLNLSPKTVENYLTQALKHLRTSLEGKFMAMVFILLTL